MQDTLSNERNLQILHTNNCREFNNLLNDRICELRNIRHINRRPYHPQSQSQEGRFNKTIKERLRRFRLLLDLGVIRCN